MFFRKRKRDRRMKFEELVELYREFGFFREVDSTAALAKLEDDFRATYPWPPSFPSPAHDIFLLAMDQTSAWNDDPEADVCAENCVYKEVLPEWAAISHGAFEPQDIVESWESDEGPINVSFILNAQTKSIHPRFRDDWMDLDVLSQINALIHNSGRCFDYIIDGNNALVITLQIGDRARLLERRNLQLGLGQ